MCILTFQLAFDLAFRLASYLAYILAFYLTYILANTLAYTLAVFLVFTLTFVIPFCLRLPMTFELLMFFLVFYSWLLSCSGYSHVFLSRIGYSWLLSFSWFYVCCSCSFLLNHSGLSFFYFCCSWFCLQIGLLMTSHFLFLLFLILFANRATHDFSASHDCCLCCLFFENPKRYSWLGVYHGFYFCCSWPFKFSSFIGCSGLWVAHVFM